MKPKLQLHASGGPMTKRFLSGLWLVALLLAWTATPSFAQSDRGAITGTVTDTMNGLIPSAVITALGISPFMVSVTVPVMAPRSDWAKLGVAVQASSSATSQSPDKNRFVMGPPEACNCSLGFIHWLIVDVIDLCSTDLGRDDCIPPPESGPGLWNLCVEIGRAHV